MQRTQNIVIAEIGEDGLSLTEYTSGLMIHSDNFSLSDNMDKEEYFNQSFDKWYENESFNVSFKINIMNPHLYSFPFPLPPHIVFHFDPNGYTKLRQQVKF